MKKLLFFAFSLLALLSAPRLAEAQEKHSDKKPVVKVKGNRSEVPKNVFKVNPLSLGVLTASVAYERAFSPTMSGQLGFFYTFPVITIASTQFGGFGITPEFRYYLSMNEAPRGFYLAPYLRYQRFKLTYTSEDPESYQTGKGTFTAFGGGVLIGKQWIMSNDRISLDVFVGPAFNSFNFKAETPSLEDKFKLPIPGAVSPRFGFTLGVAL